MLRPESSEAARRSSMPVSGGDELAERDGSPSSVSLSGRYLRNLPPVQQPT